MSRLFLPYLLGVWLLLSQFPGETSASSLKSSSRRILCKSKVVDVIDKTCGKVRRRNADFQEEFALPYGPQSGESSPSSTPGGLCFPLVALQLSTIYLPSRPPGRPPALIATGAQTPLLRAEFEFFLRDLLWLKGSCWESHEREGKLRE